MKQIASTAWLVACIAAAAHAQPAGPNRTPCSSRSSSPANTKAAAPAAPTPTGRTATPIAVHQARRDAHAGRTRGARPHRPQLVHHLGRRPLLSPHHEPAHLLGRPLGAQRRKPDRRLLCTWATASTSPWIRCPSRSPRMAGPQLLLAHALPQVRPHHRTQTTRPTRPSTASNCTSIGRSPQPARGHHVLHAQYRQEFPAKAGQDYLLFDGEGDGIYVGRSSPSTWSSRAVRRG